MPEFTQKLERARFKEFDQVSHRWDVISEPTITPEDLKQPSYWSIVSTYLRPYDEIRVRADDGSWIAWLLVKYVSSKAVGVQVLNVVELEIADKKLVKEQEDAGFVVEYMGLHNQWGVRRKSDNVVIHTGSESRRTADSWLTEHLKSLKAA